jgi:hypothetical protein
MNTKSTKVIALVILLGSAKVTAGRGPASPLMQASQRLSALRAQNRELPAADLETMAAALPALKGDRTQAYYEDRLRQFRIYNSWFTPQPGAELARVLDGQEVARGTIRDKTSAISFSAQQDWCYAVLTRWESYAAGGTKLDPEVWSSPNGTTPLQRWSSLTAGTPALATYGVCTTRATKPALRLGVSFPGSKNGLTYAVIGWPKAKVPPAIVRDLHLRRGEPCDLVAWGELWTKPIPGTFAYYRGEPHLIQSIDRTWATVVDLAFRERRVHTDDLSARPKGPPTFATQWRFRQCSIDEPETPESKKLAACVKRIGKTYDAEWNTAAEDKASAQSLSQRDRADQRQRRVAAKNAEHEENLCGPIEAPIRKRSEQLFNRLVDDLTSRPPVESLDRLGYLKAIEAAF